MMTLTPAWLVTQQLVSGLYRNLAEFVRTCAIYLGISVLVAGTMVLTMPTLRGQALQIHAALLYALVPDALIPLATTNTSAPIGTIVAAVDLEPIRGETLPPSVAVRSPPVVAPSTPSATSRADLAIPSSSSPPSSAEQNSAATNTALAPEAAAPRAPVAATKTPLATVQHELAVAAQAPASGSGASLAQVLQRQALSQNQQDALIQYLSRKYLVANQAAQMFVETAYVVGDELKVDPLLLLAIIATESRFNPYAGGQVGGPTGLMQIMMSVHRDKFTKLGRGETMVFNPVANIRVGAFILAYCIRTRGSVAGGLLCYCGASGPNADGGYTEKVLSERRRLALAGSIALKD
ncbi:MAG: transglycosylase SLT domain-containing protein [Candidatus Methylopumilus sp.]|nr:transglycosylase SLT domain-containing protein [Candidatus Methylopumilus sp.]